MVRSRSCSPEHVFYGFSKSYNLFRKTFLCVNCVHKKYIFQLQTGMFVSKPLQPQERRHTLRYVQTIFTPVVGGGGVPKLWILGLRGVFLESARINISNVLYLYMKTLRNKYKLLLYWLIDVLNDLFFNKVPCRSTYRYKLSNQWGPSWCPECAWVLVPGARSNLPHSDELITAPRSRKRGRSADFCGPKARCGSPLSSLINR